MKKFLTIVLLTMLLCVVGLTGCVNTEELELVKSDLQTQITALESITATDEELESAVSTAKSELQAQLDALNQTYATDEELESAIDTAKSALTEQTNSIKTALETTIADLKTELQGKIDTLTKTTTQKDSELEQAIKTAKETLEGQIALLNTTHNADIETLVNSINSAKEELTTQINAVKTELEKAVADLKTELQGKIDTLTNTTAEKDSELEQAIKSGIESLQAQITALENVIYKDISEINLTLNLINQTLGTTIAKIEYDELGRLVITLTNGTVLEPLEMPEIHKYGEWIVFSGDNGPCEEKIFYHVCSKCNKLEFKKGSYDEHKWEIETVSPTCQAQGYDIYTCSTCNLVEYRNYTNLSDHIWQSTYTTNNSFHWIKCNYCDEIKNEQEHVADDSGYCVVCDAVIGATVGVLYDLSSDGTYAEVIGYEGVSKNIIIASEYQGKPVKTIYDNAFKGCKLLTSVVMPEGVTTIGQSAFKGCSSLVSVAMSSDITSIGAYVFEGCSSLTSIVIPKGVTVISGAAFYGCSSLASVEIQNSVTSIGYSAFYGCKKLYTEKDNLKYIKLNNNPYYILESVTNQNLSTYNIDNSTRIIMDSAFYGCSRLTNITIPVSVTTIGYGAFEFCTSLTSIVIPENVVRMGEVVFGGCDSLTIYCEATSKPSDWDANWNYDCPVVWEYVDYTKVFTIDAKWGIVTGLTEYGKTLTELTIPDEINEITITGIDDEAFRDCDNIVSIAISDNITWIGDYAFYNCDSLVNITFGNNVRSIGGWAFCGCRSINNIIIPDSVTRIGDEAFASSSIESITLGNGITSIGPWFVESGLKGITIPESVTSIGDGAFANCYSLKDITIPESVIEIGFYAFNNCWALTSIEIPASVEVIGCGAFEECSSLIVIQYNAVECNTELKVLDNNFFYNSGCNGQGITVIIGKDVKKIPDYLFSGSSFVVQVIFEDGSVCESIGNYAFEDCSSLTRIKIPDSVTSIGYYAFEDCTSLTIYCEASAKPSDWNLYWNYSNCPVVWGYTENQN